MLHKKYMLKMLKKGLNYTKKTVRYAFIMGKCRSTREMLLHIIYTYIVLG